MSDVMIKMWNDVAETFQASYDAIGDSWESQTPCGEWTVRQLVDHAVGVQANFGSSLGAQSSDGDDWPTVKAAMQAALNDPEALTGTTEHPAFGEVPKARIFGIGISDLLLHSWDLARAIGADESLPADAVAASLEGLQQLPPEVIRAEGRFGEAIAVADDADLQTQLLGFSGRQP